MINKLIKISFILLAFILSYKLLVVTTYAQDYKADYQVDYYLTENGNELNAKAIFNIRITNYRADIYVNKFGISFPKSFPVQNLKAYDDKAELIPKVLSDESNTRIDLEFSDPNTGKNSVNNFKLEFNQSNLFKINGSVWEVILPTIESDQREAYIVTVHLPASSTKKITIAKPKPTIVTDNTITWDNPRTRTIYAVFGSEQLYDLELTYNLENPKLYPVYTEITIPPETVYQKIFFQSLAPMPVNVYLDDDGNYLARYNLKPKEKKKVIFKGIAQLSVNPREDVRPYFRSVFGQQKKYLLNKDPNWDVNIKKLNQLTNLKTVNDIYYYSVKKLSYNYKKLTEKITRLGADKVLDNPTLAVCMEFTDLFIALAREKGVYSREIQGYGFSNDPQLRPLSLISDVLHSWPEYFDDKSQIWISVDPTWENTSGIDYFNSFDLNHIAFAIHGKKSTEPLPAGMFKIENSRDVIVKATSQKPQPISELLIVSTNVPKTIIDNKQAKAKFTIQNTGNMALYNETLQIQSQDMSFSPSVIKIPVIIPYEKKELQAVFISKLKNRQKSGLITVTRDKEIIGSYTVNIIPYYYSLSLKIAFLVSILFVLIFLIKFLKKSRRLI